MKIEFDTANLTADEARGLVALLDALHGSAVLPITVNITTNPETGATTARAYAPDGYPTATASPEDWPKAAPVGANAETATMRDSAGIPWDERIHASTKTTTANGQWTRRRNTPDELFNSVMAELRAANTAMTLAAAENLYGNTDKGGVAPDGTVTIAQPEPTAAEAFADPSSQTVVATPVTIPAPPVPPAPTVPTPPPAAGGAPQFVTIMQLVTAKQRDNKLDQAKLAELLAGVGLDGIGKLVTASDDVRTNFYALVSAV